MNKLKKIILCISMIFCFSCNDKAQNHNAPIKDNQKFENFDEMLKCSEYSYDKNFFITADYGCIYKQEGNNYGNIIIYLIPKKSLDFTDEELENANKTVNGLTIEEYKNDFKIVLFLIDSKYLNYNKSGDPVYYQKSEFEQKAYTYDDKLNKWIFIDSIKILTDSQNKKEQTWRENIVSQKYENKENSKNQKQNDVAQVIQMNETQNFSLSKKQVCDLNNDDLEDYILVFKNNREFDSSDNKTKSAPIIILINKGNGSFTQYENNKIYPNNFNDSFTNLVVKNSYFTIELSNEDPNNYNLDKYITFKYDAGDVLLHKYSEMKYLSNGKTEQENYSRNNFSIVRFSDFNSNSIFEKIKK